MNEESDSDIVDTSDWPDTDDIRGWVEWRTRKLRYADDPEWKPIAEQLRARGVEPETTILADIWPEDTSMEEGVVVTADGRVFGFDYSWLHTSKGNGGFSDWRDLTSSWRIDAYPSESVAVAIQLLREHDLRELRLSQPTDPDKLRAHVIDYTRLYRSDGLNWRPLASCLTERGIDLTRAGLGSIFSEREGRTVSFVVTAAGAVFQFEIQGSTTDEWVFTEWKDVTGDATLDEHERDLIAVALEIARSG